jgi:hypothetical protein
MTTFDDVLLPITRRDEPLTETCPSCNGVNTIVHVIGAPNIGDAVRLGRLHLPSTWTDKLAKIKQKHHRSTMNVPAPGKREI